MGTPLSAMATKTERWCGVSCVSTPRLSAVSTSRCSSSSCGDPSPSAIAQTPSSAGSSLVAHSRRLRATEVWMMANFHAQVVKRLSPRKSSR